MRSNGESFYHFAHRLSLQHHRFFSSRELGQERTFEFDDMVDQSFKQQAKIESQEQQDFDQFLDACFAPAYAAMNKVQD